MADLSAKLKLPYLAAAQAQKHVTHNQALALLDAVVQLTVMEFDAVSPPLTLTEGAVYALGVGATGAWLGQDGRLALVSNGGWQFLIPQIGWRAALGTELRLWDGADWVPPPLPDLQNLPGLGIGTSYSGANTLSVAGAATLLTHVGADHHLKVNKALAANTASLLFQTGWSGRAEMGTTGTDDFSIKVSPDGSTWFPALTALGATGKLQFGAAVAAQPGSPAAPSVAFAADADTGLFSIADNSLGLATGGVQRARVHNGGLEVTGAITGTAVTQTASDATAGRLMKVGDAGLLGIAPSFGAGTTWASVTQSQMISCASNANQPTDKPLPTQATPYVGWHLMSGALRWGEIVQETAGSYPWRIWARTSNAGVTQDWDLLFSRKSVLGAVSQTSGVPTGGLIERGSNANGEYVRFADGTQICTRTVTASALAIGTAFLGGFRSAGVSWAFPASFVAAPVMAGTALLNSSLTPVFDAPTVSGVIWSAVAFTSQAAADRTVTLTVLGRWF
jgi:hypothetical protein